MQAKPLEILTGKDLLALDVEPPKFIVSRFLPAGLHLLAGSPKIGKSWLALWLCHQVSRGAPAWEFDTLQCGALYLSLEDTVDRLHFRLARIAEEGTEQSYFATHAETLSGDLLAQLEAFMQAHPDTGLIVIDTFQRIRDANEKGDYSRDYEEVNRIKAVADKHKIAILLVHHLRKMPDSDPFNMVSGSTGIIGAVDSLYVLEKDCRTDNKAKLHVTGRDIEDMQLFLEFDRAVSTWRFVSFLHDTAQGDEKLIAALKALGTFSGTATELVTALHGVDSGLDLKPSGLTRTLKEQALTLEKRHGLSVQFSRTSNTRLVSFSVGEVTASP